MYVAWRRESSVMRLCPRRICDRCGQLLDNGRASIELRELAINIDAPEWQPAGFGLPIYIKAV